MMPYFLLPTPYSLLPTPYSLLPTPYSLCYRQKSGILVKFYGYIQYLWVIAKGENY
ncbi:MAG: hypothetical protein F6J94_29425 [Moorea sp. SIO1F2]|uniref:hypothetical protein n=1 Tax=Moorena sp. SIO1F2 TaxID=2607819 RepID=UPI0013BDAD7B|nr:hypothetical protein [Moorena sp. SIO1F2]NET85862.1 hypothetical protein [Moorena sp. SIO1F2]